MNLSDRLRQLRRERGWRLLDLSARAELSVPYLSDLERGRTVPSLATLKVIAGAYDLSVQDVLDGVAWYGEASDAAYPVGLRQLLADPALGVPAEWGRALARIEHKGVRPRTKQDWLEVYLNLRHFLN